MATTALFDRLRSAPAALLRLGALLLAAASCTGEPTAPVDASDGDVTDAGRPDAFTPDASADGGACPGAPDPAVVFDARFGCGTRYTSERAGDRGWTVYSSGIQVDETFQRAWTPELGQVGVETDIVAECAALSVAGLTWRAPIVDDLRRSFAGGCNGVENASLSDPSCLSFACNDIPSCLGSPDSDYCQDDVPTCVSWIATTSECSDCGEVCPTCAGMWTYQSANGTFVSVAPPGLALHCIADVPSL